MTVVPMPDRPTSIRLAELHLDTPQWLIEAATDRNGQHMARRPDRPPDPGLYWQWALDYCRLPAVDRRLLDVIKNLPSKHGAHNSIRTRIAERTGANEKTVRDHLLDLERWGWLNVEQTHGRPSRYEVTIPVREPPDRMARPGRRRSVNHAR